MMSGESRMVSGSAAVAAASAFASRIASRSDPVPESFGFETSWIVADAGPEQVSTATARSRSDLLMDATLAGLGRSSGTKPPRAGMTASGDGERRVFEQLEPWGWLDSLRP